VAQPADLWRVQQQYQYLSSNEKGDCLSAILPGAKIETDTAPRDFSLTYQTLMLNYLNYTDQNRFGCNNSIGLSDFERLGPNTSLTISDSFLMGNSVGSGLMTNGAAPVNPQILQALLNQSTSSNNYFNAQLATRFSDTFHFSASAFQNLFVDPSTSVAKYSFSQGGAVSADRLIGERVTAGFSYQFSDFRFTGNDVATTDTHWPQLRVGWGLNTPINLLAQVGPVISSSSSGIIGSTPEPARTSVNLGWMLSANYTGRRWTINASGGQQPSLSSGLAGVSTAQNYSALAQYKMTRLATLYVNGGYYSANGTGISDKVASYSAGITYRWNRMLAFNARFVDYQTRISGSSPASIGATTQGTTNTNMFQIGAILTPEPFRWNI
jgi:hypothetical protein